MASVLEDFYDEALAEAGVVTLDPHEFAIEEHNRLVRVAMVGALIGRWPVRLPEKETRGLDRLTGRKISHLARQMSGGWAAEFAQIIGAQRPDLPAVQVTGGATYHPGTPGWKELVDIARALDWSEYCYTLVENSNERAVIVATYAIEAEHRKYGNRALNRLLTEVERTKAILEPWLIRREAEDAIGNA